ncbi:DnaJ domain protein [Desulfosarcina cetonica]|uniref:DnaJ domain-containing protein n=1 Tax=Desulfosarcina cetonica TaxID=90730 RepID=UPI0006CF2EBF|nr:DnaJ domain-containing protein [Desulfosarcina cetonica]VTR71250.1 DnaJ domain protein [Desulfosarcina cetonica]
MNRLILLCLFIVALLYLVFPRDLVPDYFLGWGWIDDIVVVVLLWRYFRRLKQPRQTDDPHEQPFGATGDEQSHVGDENTQTPQDPYAILEITPGASKEEIKAAYRRLAGKYHPDKVQHLGEEFQRLAEKRFKEIQTAYDRLR